MKTKARLIIFTALILLGKLLLFPIDIIYAEANIGIMNVISEAISGKVLIETDEAVPFEYINYEKHIDPFGFRDSTDYIKYNYNSNSEKLFSDNEMYLKVNYSDINTLVEFYDNFKDWMSTEDRENEFDMKKSCITEGDYYRIENWWYGNTDSGSHRLVKTEESEAVGYSLLNYYNFYYYDTETSTLYYLHNDT